MKISITVYDENYKKVFSVVKIDLNAGMYKLSSFVQTKIGLPLKVVNTNGNSTKCHICKMPINKGRGMTYEGKTIHQECLLTARQQLP